jgi:hypothetical protein
MIDGRTLHTASLLLDGRVLIAGGSPTPDGSSPVDTAELYDPSTRTFSPAGIMPTASASHTASVLLDGSILVSGGWGIDCPGTQKAMAIFDPASNTFSPSVNLSIARAEHTSTTLNDGSVLITGGSSVDFCNMVGTTLDTAVVFHPSSSSFSEGPLMREPRARHSAILLADGTVLVVGSTAELFDPVTSSFSITGDPNASVVDGRALRLSDGRVLFISPWVAEIYE